MASGSLSKWKERVEGMRRAGRNIRERAKQKTGALVQRGAAGGAGYWVGYCERERKEMPGAKIERVGTMNMNAIAGFPAATVYSVAGTMAQLLLPAGGVMAKIGDAADGGLDGLMGAGMCLYGMSRPRDAAAAAAAEGIDMGAEEEVAY